MPIVLSNRCLHQRLRHELALDACGRTIERRPHLEVGIRLRIGASLRAGAGLGQQVVLQEVIHGLRNFRLAVCPVALERDTTRLDSRCRRERDEHRDERRCRRDADAMPPNELADAIPRARRACENRLVVEMAPEIRREIRDRSVPARPILLERLHRDPVEITSQPAGQLVRIGSPARSHLRGRGAKLRDADARAQRILLPQQPRQLDDPLLMQLLAVERQTSREQLVQQHAQSVDVGSRIDIDATRFSLLRAHIPRRADHQAEAGVQGARHERLGDRLRDAEVDDFRRRPVIPHRNQNVRWLEVAVDDAFLMRVLDTLAHLEEEREALLGPETHPVAVRCDGLAFHVLHREVRPSVLSGPSVEDCGDGRMVHQSKRLALRLEPRDHLPAVHARFDQLQGDQASHRMGLLGHPDLAHPAFAEPIEQPVRAQRSACGPCRRTEWCAAPPALSAIDADPWSTPVRYFSTLP